MGRNALEQRGLPIVCAIGNFPELGLRVPGKRRGQSIRVWARSLSVMQKEAVVYSTLAGSAWRLASDEGPYLNGHDFAPCPLSFMTTGMAASYMTEITALARQRGIEIAEIVLTQHNYYTMEGSIRAGTMIGGALPVELRARIESDAADDALVGLLEDAVRASPVHGLLAGAQRSSFTLTSNGAPVRLDPALQLDAPAEPPARDAFERIAPAGEPDRVEKLEPVEARAGVAGGAGTSLQDRQSRTLHLKATCRLREDGAKVVEQELLSPLGSTFAFVCDEPAGSGGRGLAPDAMSYVSAGIAFCFMTQLGRYAKIIDKNLVEYDVVQDTHFSLGGASGGSGRPGAAAPVATHVHLATIESDRFAQSCVEMGEQTCFLHALCRTPLETQVRLERS